MNNYNHYLVLALSATLFNIALFWPTYCAWLIFIFLIPIFYLVFSGYRLSFKHGLWWGLIFYGLHFIWLFRMFYEYASGWLRMLAPTFLWIYFACFAGLWFWIASRLSQNFNSMLATAVIWIGVTSLYFYWVDSAGLIILGTYCSYPFVHPLLPLAFQPKWLAFLPVLGKDFFMALLVGFSAATTAGLVTTRKRTVTLLVVVLILFIPFLWGWMVPNPKTTVPSMVKNIAYVSPHELNVETSYDDPFALFRTFERLLNKIKIISQHRPDLKLFVMPECSFKLPLDCCPDLIALLYEYLPSTATCIIGAHRNQKDKNNTIKCYNTTYVIQDRCIVDSYDKRFLMPFTEYVPFPWCHFKFMYRFFLSNNDGYEVAEKEKVFALSDDIQFIPMVCSELFLFFRRVLGDKKIKQDLPDTPIIAMVNDDWFAFAYMPRVMYAVAYVTALSYQRDTLYVAPSRCTWISKNGEQVSIC